RIVIGLIAAGLALALLMFAGGFPGRVVAAEGVGRVAGSLLAGAVAVHLGLTLADRAGIAWSRPLVLVVVAVGAVSWRLLGRRERAAHEPRPRFSWGLLVGSIPVLLFAGLAAVHLAVTPDFAFHWGTKAARWVAERGVDVTLF